MTDATPKPTPIKRLKAPSRAPQNKGVAYSVPSAPANPVLTRDDAERIKKLLGR